jgi:Leucyl aminopeptidase
MQRFALPAVLAASALVLTACLDVDADITVNPDATATGNMTVAISSEFSGLLGLASGNDLVDQIEQGALEGAEGVDDLDCSPLDRDGAVAMNCTFEDLAFEEADDLWNIYAGDDGTVTFVTTSGEEVTQEDAGLLGDLHLRFRWLRHFRRDARNHHQRRGHERRADFRHHASACRPALMTTSMWWSPPRMVRAVSPPI